MPLGSRVCWVLTSITKHVRSPNRSCTRTIQTLCSCLSHARSWIDLVQSFGVSKLGDTSRCTAVSTIQLYSEVSLARFNPKGSSGLPVRMLPLAVDAGGLKQGRVPTCGIVVWTCRRRAINVSLVLRYKTSEVLILLGSHGSCEQPVSLSHCDSILLHRYWLVL
jgi:hypothetical protein